MCINYKHDQKIVNSVLSSVSLHEKDTAVDKEIEALLHSLNIQPPFPPTQDIHEERHLPPPKEESIPEKNTPHKQPKKKKKSFFFWSLGQIFLALGIGLLSASSCAYFLLHEDPASPLRIVEKPILHESVFFSPTEEKGRSLPISFSPFQKDGSSISDDETPFFLKTSYSDELFTAELEENRQALQRQKKGLQAALEQMNLFAEKDALRLLMKNFSSYLRSQLLLSSSFEERVREKESIMKEEEQKRWRLFLNLYGGFPLKGCQGVVGEGGRLQKEWAQCMKTFFENHSLEEHAFMAMKAVKLLEKMGQEPLLSVLVDGKEERKKLEEAIMSLLASFEKQRGEAKRYSVEEWRALSFLKWILSKKPIVDWHALDKELFQKPRTLLIENQNTLFMEARGFCSLTKRIDW